MRTKSFLKSGIRGLIFTLVLLCMIIIVAGQGYCDLELNKTKLPGLIKTPSISVSPNPISIGQTVTVTGKNFNTTPHQGDTYPIAGIEVLYQGEEGPFSVDLINIQPDGSFSYERTIPQGMTPGTYPLFGVDRWGHKTQTVDLVVILAATPTPTSTPTVQGTATLQAMATSSPTVIATGTPDTTAPVTTLNLAGIKGADGVFTSNVVCTLTAEDNGSGVNATEYSFDGTNWAAYTGPFTVTTPGNTSIFFRSTDKAGNQEMTKAEAVTIIGSASMAASTPGAGSYIDVILSILVMGSVGLYGIKNRKGK